MFTYPDNIYEKLEFDKIIELTIQYCRGEKAKSILRNPRIFNTKSKIESLLQEVYQLKILLAQGQNFPIRAYQEIKDDLYWLKKIDYVLELESIHRIYDQIWTIFELIQYFDSEANQQVAPAIYDIIQRIDFDVALIKKFHRIFDDEGQIKPDASPELAKIFKLFESKKRELERTFNGMARKYSELGYLKDNKETLRNGRRVLSVKAEYKRKIKGIIHDESATGRTVYIEPDDVLHVNNELFELQAKIRNEIRKIINELCNFLRPHIPSFEFWQRAIVRLDIIHSKAKLSLLYNGSMPEIVEEQSLELIDARHPYLFLINQESDKDVIPFDVKLDAESRILVISGPNAGGKSVTMKSIGLLSLMLQSGMLVTVDPKSKMGIFKSFFVDIGDQQSLEDDLSTYSSRLTNMRVFLEKVKSKSLFLIDEFGSGTDPKLGGAIAEAILTELVRKQSLGVITTHYSNLKIYAHKNKGLINGAMQFDNENLQPTYRLSIGKPGSSFAYEIASKAGIPKKVINYAQHKTGANTKAVEQLLVELQEEKRLFELKLAQNEKEKEKLNRLIKSYESAYGDLEVKRKRMKMEKKELKLKQINESKLEIKELIKELKKEKKLDDAIALADKVKTEQSELIEDLEVIRDDIYSAEGYDYTELKVGDYVKMRSGGQIAEIISIEKSNATLAMGMLQVTAPLKELLPANTPIEINRRKSVITKTNSNPMHLTSKLDIREYNKDDAMAFLQEFVDNALMSNLPELKIIHGKGTGVLRKAVLQKLKEYKDIQKVWHPEDEAGGIGVTFVKF